MTASYIHEPMEMPTEYPARAYWIYRRAWMYHRNNSCDIAQQYVYFKKISHEERTQ